MKNLVRFAVAGALLAGYTVAQAQPALPSSDNADLWLFVSDQSASTTFAEDTGISIASLMPTSSLVSGADLSTAISDSVNLAANSALSNYITSNGASNLEWAVEAVQFPGNPNGTGYKKAGGDIGIFSTSNASDPGGLNTAALQLGNMESWAAGFNGDVTYLAQTYTAGGKSYAFSSGANVGNVWGSTGPSLTGGSTNLYGNGPDQSGVGLGSSSILYGLTGNGGTGQLQSYVLSSQLELTDSGLLETVSGTGTSPVPLPPAVWLFASGLLGLAGVGRRRSGAAGTAAA